MSRQVCLTRRSFQSRGHFKKTDLQVSRVLAPHRQTVGLWREPPCSGRSAWSGTAEPDTHTHTHTHTHTNTHKHTHTHTHIGRRGVSASKTSPSCQRHYQRTKPSPGPACLVPWPWGPIPGWSEPDRTSRRSECTTGIKRIWHPIHIP